jgi:hypothetical protein
MWSIIKWIFSIAMLFLVLYIALVIFNAVKKEGVSGILSPVGDVISNLFSSSGVPNPFSNLPENFAQDFFKPQIVAAPLTVVPSAAWYENMDAVYRQIYLNNLSYYNNQNTGGFNYNQFFNQYATNTQGAIATQSPVYTTSILSKIQLLFPTPSTYMELRNNLKDNQ